MPNFSIFLLIPLIESLEFSQIVGRKHKIRRFKDNDKTSKSRQAQEIVRVGPEARDYRVTLLLDTIIGVFVGPLVGMGRFGMPPRFGTLITLPREHPHFEWNPPNRLQEMVQRELPVRTL